MSITQEIRQGLKAERELGESVTAVQLVSRNLSKEQSQHLNNYQLGDYIKLHRNYKGTPLQKGQLYKVEGYKDSELVVSSYGGRVYRFNPSKFKDKQVFTSREIEIAVGDNLRWTAGADKNKGQINGQQITVSSFDTTEMKVVDNQGQTQSVSLLQPLPVDYNLVSTSYRAQGKSKKRVIVSATNDPTSSLEPFYVKISRQIKELTVYTQNLEKLRGWVNRSNAQQNPVELIGEYYVRNKYPRNLTSDRATQPTELRTQRTDGSDRTTEYGNQRTDSYQLRENSLYDHLSSKSIYRTTNRDNAEQERKRDARIDSGTNGGNKQALHQSRPNQLDLPGYQTDNSQYQAENITNRVQRLPQPLDRQDTKPTTIVNVRRDMVRGIELLEAQGSQVKVLKWNPSDGKGLDDLIANQGASAYAKAHQEAISPDLDKRTHYRTEYNKLAKKVHQELGNNISAERLELEIYTRMATKGELADGTRVVGESDFARLLKQEQPHMVKPYLKAIAKVAGTYKNLSDKNEPNLDALAKKMVNQHTVEFQLQEEDTLRQSQVRSKRSGRGL